MSDMTLEELRAVCSNLESFKKETDLTRREGRIQAFYDLLHELPEGPDKGDEAAQRAGLTAIDLEWLHRDNERAEKIQEAMFELHCEEQTAWRRHIITALQIWDDVPDASRKEFVIMMRDFFTQFAAQDAVLP